jgi:predicted transcriptional regulator
MTYLQKPAGMAESGHTEVKRVVSRRSQLEIRMDILRAIMEGAEGPTQIMYKANLSWILLCDHLSALGEQGFVGEKSVGNRKKYSLTGKGIEIVGAYLNLIREIIFETAKEPA